jgi:DNA-binding protein Fis
VSLESLERDLIRQALERAGGNRTRAAALLGLTRDTLRYRLEKHGIS